EAFMGRHGAEAKAGPCFGRAFNDKGATLIIDRVGIGPNPAAAGAHEEIHKGFKDLARSQPGVLVGAQAHVGLKASSFETCTAVHAIAGYDEIDLWQLRQCRHLLTELDMHTQASGAVRQDVQETLSTDGVAAANAQYLFPLDI